VLTGSLVFKCERQLAG